MRPHSTSRGDTAGFLLALKLPARFTVQGWDVVPDYGLFQKKTSFSGGASSRVDLQVVECSFDRRCLGLE